MPRSCHCTANSPTWRPTTILPEIVVGHWRHRILHNRGAPRLRRGLRHARRFGRGYQLTTGSDHRSAMDSSRSCACLVAKRMLFELVSACGWEVERLGL
jgi:hypothetical protein